MTRASEETVRNLLAKGKTTQWVSDATGWPVHRVQRIAAQSASAPAVIDASDDSPDLRRLREEAEAVVQPRDEVKARVASTTELLVRADAINDRRIQAALGRARKALTDLAGLVAAYDEKAQLRARVSHLEEQLAAAKAEMRGPKRQAMPPREADDVDHRAIRQWARDNNVACPDVGRVPAKVVTAYEAAQQEAVSV